jgi:hypothetical protein
MMIEFLDFVGTGSAMFNIVDGVTASPLSENKTF